MLGRNIIVNGRIRDVFFSNIYFTFANQYVREDNNEVNKHSLLVYKKGKRLCDEYLDFGLTKTLMRYNDKIYYFIEKEKNNSLYVLLTNIIDIPQRPPIDTRINIPSNYLTEGYHLINTYEAFMNYTKAHQCPMHSGSNEPFFGDFILSLTLLDFSKYPSDDTFGFFKLENQKHPRHYYYFLVFQKYICLTNYKNPPNIPNKNSIMSNALLSIS